MALQRLWFIGKSGFPVWGVLVMVCAAALPMISDQQSDSRVIVVSVTGDWTRMCQAEIGDCKGADRPVKFGETIAAGAICLYGPEHGSIVLKSWPHDDLLYPFQCQKEDLGKKKTCEKPRPEACAVDLSKLREKKSFYVRVIRPAFERIAQSQPDKYMVAASRGAESELLDAVVPIENGQIDLQASFREMDPGTYYVELGTVGAASLSVPPSRVTFAKGQAARVEARGVRAGLYKLALVTEQGEPGDSDCWILAVAPPEYAKQTAAFEQAVSESKKLPDEMDAGATRALLRAYLESLGTAVRP